MELVLEPLSRPKIDIHKIKPGKTPLKTVQLMDPVEFEVFVSEWLSYKDYSGLKRVGGTGDMGRDIIAYYEDGNIDIFQCKHYSSKFNEVGDELLTFIYNMSEGRIPKVNCYTFVCLNGLATKWADAIDNGSIQDVWLNWFNDSKKSKDPKYTNITKYLDKNGFPKVCDVGIEVVIKEHMTTPYGKFRFGLDPKIDRKLPDADVEKDGEYLKQLLKLFSKYEGKELTFDNFNNSKFSEMILRHRGYFYSAESLHSGVKDYFTDDEEYIKLENDIFHGIIDFLETQERNTTEYLYNVTTEAAKIQTTDSKLDSMFHLVSVPDRKGICHVLVNKGEFKWFYD